MLNRISQLNGSRVSATESEIGHVTDAYFDDQAWAVRYLVVVTRNWWPGGKKVLISTNWIDQINWAEQTDFITLTHKQIRKSPEYDETATLDRAYEQRLHNACSREADRI